MNVMLCSKRIYIGEFIPLSTVGRQTFPYRIMEGLSVIHPESMPSAEITSYKPTSQD
jgi:hypothetical protein